MAPGSISCISIKYRTSINWFLRDPKSWHVNCQGYLWKNMFAITWLACQRKFNEQLLLIVTLWTCDMQKQVQLPTSKLEILKLHKLSQLWNTWPLPIGSLADSHY